MANSAEFQAFPASTHPDRRIEDLAEDDGAARFARAAEATAKAIQRDWLGILGATAGRPFGGNGSLGGGSPGLATFAVLPK